MNHCGTYLVLFDHVAHLLATTRLQSLVTAQLESQARCVVAGRLLGIAHVERDVIEGQEFASIRLNNIYICYIYPSN